MFDASEGDDGTVTFDAEAAGRPGTADLAALGAVLAWTDASLPANGLHAGVPSW